MKKNVNIAFRLAEGNLIYTRDFFRNIFKKTSMWRLLQCYYQRSVCGNNSLTTESVVKTVTSLFCYFFFLFKMSQKVRKSWILIHQLRYERIRCEFIFLSFSCSSKAPNNNLANWIPFMVVLFFATFWNRSGINKFQWRDLLWSRNFLIK